MKKCFVCGKDYPESRAWCPHCEKRRGKEAEGKLDRYAAVAERVRVEQYEVARPVGSEPASRWEPRWDVKVSFLARDVAEAFAKALQEAKAPTESPFSKVRESAARLGETIAEWDAKFGNKPPNAELSGPRPLAAEGSRLSDGLGAEG